MGNAIKFRIWDRQGQRFVAAPPLASGWAIDAFCGELINFERVNAEAGDSATYSVFFSPEHYSDGLDIIKANRYVLSNSRGLRTCIPRKYTKGT